jgi:DNA helicase II / ATP-dependent DNA helicase PcrA
VPPLIEQMERLQSLAARRRSTPEGAVDPRSPYFGHLLLEERGKKREVLIGRSTYLDTESGIRIVDWRDAPVSRLYYRYQEGDDYSEIFGDREVEGEIKIRRSVTITDRVLRRIGAPQGMFVKGAGQLWRRLAADSAKLHGGQGTATRAEQHHRPGKLGAGEGLLSDDKHLKEITALIDPRQFELITRADSGLVVIQGGAGSGKTTIGLHRLAYLAYQDQRRFRPDRMLVVVFNDALARYIAQVLPALGVQGVAIRTYQDWASRLRALHVPETPHRYADDTPGDVTRLKKHPLMLAAIEAHVRGLEERIEQQIAKLAAVPGNDSLEALWTTWQKSRGRPVAHRLYGFEARLSDLAQRLPTDARVGLERAVKLGLREAKDVISHWADLLTDRARLAALFTERAPGQFSAGDLNRVHAWCTAAVTRLLSEIEEARDSHSAPAPTREKRAKRERPAERGSDFDPIEGIDGRAVEEGARFDREDDTLLLRLQQRLVGPLLRGNKAKEALVYEHVLIDEAQDLSPVELAVVLDTVSKGQSLTLAGDAAQRLHLDNGFVDFPTLLGDLGLSHVEVEPLRVSYRSTRQIVDFARAVLGPLAPEEPAVAPRSGASVEAFTFEGSGEAVAFLAENLRQLMQAEPRASVALIARYPEQADVYYNGLVKAEIAHLRRIAEQDFPFKPGIDVTDVRQTKGLEFDYVVLLEVTASSYPSDDEARHLLHIAATRAAHQLWVLTTPQPSELLPRSLIEPQ